MYNIAVIYYSNTGNTAAMAYAVAEGAEVSEDFNVEIFEASEFVLDNAEDYDAFAFGCPASEDENLEADEFEPVFSYIEEVLENRPIVIFGSFSDGDGEWMEKWEERCYEQDLNLVRPGLIVEDYPEDDELDLCLDLGEDLAHSLDY